MDKRLFLALLLTALVVVLTPVVFPTPRPVRSTISDTTATAPVRSSPVQSLVVAPRTASPASEAPRAPVLVTAETTTVQGGGSTYRFINPGAVPVSVALIDYQSL